jgi:hypothetical protein
MAEANVPLTAALLLQYLVSEVRIISIRRWPQTLYADDTSTEVAT